MDLAEPWTLIESIESDTYFSLQRWKFLASALLQTVLFELIELEILNWPFELSSVHSMEQIGPVAKVRVQLGSHLAG